MNFETYDKIPESRLDFERVMNLVREMSHNGNLFLREGIENHGLDLVRELPNGRYNLLTINEGARTIANMTANRQQMENNQKKEKG